MDKIELQVRSIEIEEMMKLIKDLTISNIEHVTFGNDEPLSNIDAAELAIYDYKLIHDIK